MLCCLRDLDEHTIVDLEETEELQNFSGFWGDLVDTPDTDDEVDLGLGGNVEVASGTCSALEADLLLLLVKVLLCVLLSALEDDLALGLCVLNKE